MTSNSFDLAVASPLQLKDIHKILKLVNLPQEMTQDHLSNFIVTEGNERILGLLV